MIHESRQRSDIKNNADFMKKCKKLVGLFSHSTLLNEELIDDQKTQYPGKEPEPEPS